MFQRTLIPEPLREFLPYLSSNAFRVVPWSQLIKKSIALVVGKRESLSIDSYSRIVFCEGFPEGSIPLSSASVSSGTRKWIGQEILKLYFENVRSPAAIAIDFRISAFCWDPKSACLYWNPVRLALKWDADFSKHVFALYDAYYSGDHSELRGTLTALGFIGPLESDASFAELMALLENHFGPGDQKETRFSSRKLTQTLHALFLELERRGSRLQPDFAFLGIMLATMTGTLETLGIELDARAAFNETRFPKTV